jgi:predicted DCC family thiol-disulfide oxidoreductase YuxK
VDWGKAHLNPWVATKASQQLSPADYGLTPEDFKKSIWLINTKEGAAQPLAANRAVAKILQNQKNILWRSLGIILDIWWIRPIASLVYYAVAANREKMPGATDECKIPKD